VGVYIFDSEATARDDGEIIEEEQTGTYTKPTVQ